MKKNILVIDPSIMIHKIVQLAFPDEQYSVFFSNSYPPTETPEKPVSMVLVSADLPDTEDAFAVAADLKNEYSCRVFMMIPKFFEYDESKVAEHGLDGAIEKPFTSDALREQVGPMDHPSVDLDSLESLSPEELESITEDEFMLSEEDLIEISEDELADVDIPEDAIRPDEPETEDLKEDVIVLAPTDEEPEKDIEESELLGDSTTEETASSAEVEKLLEEAPFEDMEMDEELDSIDFGDLEDGEALLDRRTFVEEKAPEKAETVFEEDFDEPESEPVDQAETPEDIFGEQEIGVQTMQEAVLAEGMQVEDETTSPEPAAVLEQIVEEPADEEEPLVDAEEEPVLDIDLGAEEEAEDVVQIEEEKDVFEQPAEVFVQPEVEEPLEPESVDESADESKDAESESSDIHVEEEEETVQPLDLSHADEDVELIPSPGTTYTPVSGTQGTLTDADVQRIAQKVVEMLSDDVLRSIAWEVIPVVAEEVVRNRIRELEKEDVE